MAFSGLEWRPSDLGPPRPLQAPHYDQNNDNHQE